MDGIVFTGSRSNIQPHHYAGAPASNDSHEDPARDQTTLPLIPQVIDKGIPMLCICRGFQELNVALGGTLHQQLYNIPDTLQHLPPDDLDPEQRFALSHEIEILDDSILSTLTDSNRVMVNSVHGQGIDTLAEGLIVEARADDGVIEAVRVADSRNFALAVQWHPEWDWREHDLDARLWSVFAEACRAE